MFDDWPKKKNHNFFHVLYIISNRSRITSLLETILAKVRFNDKVTDENYRNLCFPAEIATNAIVNLIWF